MLKKKSPRRRRATRRDAGNSRFAGPSVPEWERGRVPIGFWDDPANQRRYLVWLGKKLGIKKLDDWYQSTVADFVANGAIKLLARHRSFHGMFERLFPDHDWVPWRFRNVSHGYWSKLQNRQRYMRWLGKQLGYIKPEDWYQVSREDFGQHHGKGLLSDAGRTIRGLVAEAVPDFDFKPWLFRHVPVGFWRKKTNRLLYMKWLELELGYGRPTDWLNLKAKDFAEHAGGAILHVARMRPHQLVAELYLNRIWHPWLFSQLEHNYWKDPAHRVAYLKWLGKRLGYRRPTDWFGIQRRDFARNHGYVIVDEWDGDFTRAIREIYPKLECEPWMLKRIPHGSFWEKQPNRRRYMTWLAKRLGIKKPIDWYQVRSTDLRQHYGKGLIHKLQSVAAIVLDAFPEHSWKPWLFDRVPHGFWSSRRNRNDYFDWLAVQLKIRDASDWGRIQNKDQRELHFGGLLNSVFAGSVRKLQAAAKRRWIERSGSAPGRFLRTERK